MLTTSRVSSAQNRVIVGSEGFPGATSPRDNEARCHISKPEGARGSLTPVSDAKLECHVPWQTLFRNLKIGLEKRDVAYKRNLHPQLGDGAPYDDKVARNSVFHRIRLFPLHDVTF